MSASQRISLLEDYVSSGVIDHRGDLARKSTSGKWRSATFIIASEVLERAVYFGITANLISYLTGPIGQSTKDAATNVNTWMGTSFLLPIFGAYLTDAYLSRYLVTAIACLIYIVGLGLLTLSTILANPEILSASNALRIDCSSSTVNVIVFISLYLVAIAQAGQKPSLQAFGADQFDPKDPHELVSRTSFFNWWFLFIAVGASSASGIIVYVQEYVNWTIGFTIPLVCMVLSILVFLLGTRTYRYEKPRGQTGNPFTRIGRVLYVAFKNRKLSFHGGSTGQEANLSQESLEDTRFLKKALIDPKVYGEDGPAPCKSSDVEDVMTLTKLIPIWIAALACTIPFAQYQTFFTKQGATVDRKIFLDFEIPPASLQVLMSGAIVILTPVYERVFVPFARSITKEPAGITMLQRMGAGMVATIISMVVSGLVETMRLDMARQHGLVDLPNITIPMSIWWFVPQYVLCGLSALLVTVAQQEFFYDQVPSELKTIGIALFLSLYGIGCYLSNILIVVIESITGGNGGDSWFSPNINRAHLDYFYFLIAAICAFGFLVFLCVSKSYVYRQ